MLPSTHLFRSRCRPRDASHTPPSAGPLHCGRGERLRDAARASLALFAAAGAVAACGADDPVARSNPAVDPHAPGTATDGSDGTPAARAAAKSEGTNGCLEADWSDATGRDAVEIRFGEQFGHNYVPRCVVVSPGTSLRFLGPFDTHPFVGGKVVNGLPISSRGSSRFAPVARGDGAEFRIDEVGDYGYYCDMHVVEGMLGAVRVVGR